MSTKPTLPKSANASTDTDEFDPYRFGKISFTTGFFKKLITTPLPEPNEEDMLHTVPPGEGPSAEEARRAVARMRAHYPEGESVGTQQETFTLSPDEAQAIGAASPGRRRLVVYAAACAVVGAMLALLTFWNRADGEQRVVRSAAPSQDPAGPVSDVEHRGSDGINEEVERASPGAMFGTDDASKASDYVGRTGGAVVASDTNQKLLPSRPTKGQQSAPSTASNKGVPQEPVVEPLGSEAARGEMDRRPSPLSDSHESSVPSEFFNPRQ